MTGHWVGKNDDLSIKGIYQELTFTGCRLYLLIRLEKAQDNFPEKF